MAVTEEGEVPLTLFKLSARVVDVITDDGDDVDAEGDDDDSPIILSMVNPGFEGVVVVVADEDDAVNEGVDEELEESSPPEDEVCGVVKATETAKCIFAACGEEGGVGEACSFSCSSLLSSFRY